MMAHSAKPGTHAFELQTVSDATRVTRTPAVDSKAEPEDIAFILRTSGTTAHPKLVPVSHRNLAAMAVGVWKPVAHPTKRLHGASGGVTLCQKGGVATMSFQSTGPKTDR
jgi:long-subunit acyl-CoA synthetase (AMP-forming)